MAFEEYYTGENGRICIAADQASRFAKDVAGDFNPLHNADSRRFCVPGDLLFALILARFGLYQRMALRFHSMVGDRALLHFQQQADCITVETEAGKVCLEARHEGEVTTDEEIVEQFARHYVAFSGHNFPHYLKPLLEEQGVMFNPQRPLVIYDSMDFSLEELPVREPNVEFARGSLEVQGKRAVVLFEFHMHADGKTIGTGSKKLMIGGLIPYDAQVMDETITGFNRMKSEYESRTAQARAAGQ